MSVIDELYEVILQKKENPAEGSYTSYLFATGTDKILKKIGEEYKIAVRNVRRDSIETLKKLKKDKEISEDEQFRLQEEAQKVTDGFISQVDEIAGGKEKEVMEV